MPLAMGVAMIEFTIDDGYSFGDPVVTLFVDKITLFWVRIQYLEVKINPYTAFLTDQLGLCPILVFACNTFVESTTGGNFFKNQTKFWITSG